MYRWVHEEAHGRYQHRGQALEGEERVKHTGFGACCSASKCHPVWHNQIANAVLSKELTRRAMWQEADPAALRGV